MFIVETDVADRSDGRSVLSHIIRIVEMNIEDESGLFSKELLNVVVTVLDPLKIPNLLRDVFHLW